jgi:predicted deacylase
MILPKVIHQAFPILRAAEVEMAQVALGILVQVNKAIGKPWLRTVIENNGIPSVNYEASLDGTFCDLSCEDQS